MYTHKNIHTYMYTHKNIHTYMYTHKNIQLYSNNGMFNNTSTVGRSQKATVIVTNHMGILVLFLESVQGAKTVSMMKI